MFAPIIDCMIHRLNHVYSSTPDYQFNVYICSSNSIASLQQSTKFGKVHREITPLLFTKHGPHSSKCYNAMNSPMVIFKIADTHSSMEKLAHRPLQSICLRGKEPGKCIS